jgi:[acyl-carrier-protein] S-malonyltransferase
MKLAFVFPGQGSQALGMMQSFTDNQAVRDTFAEAAEALHQDLWQLAAEGPAAELNSTVNTQPLMLTAAYAMYRAWQQAGGLQPAMLAGHSLGEYTALVVAGVISFRDAVPLVRFRAQAMQEAVPLGTGAMAAVIGLDETLLRAACSEGAGGETVEPVNFNGPGQIVIAGHKTAVERAAAAAKAKGAKRAMLLPVSAPFHSSLLKPAAERLAEHLTAVQFNAPQIPVVNNVDVAVVNDKAHIKDALARQASNPVRWTEVIQFMARSNVTHVAECGPGKVLSGLTRRIEGTLKSLSISDATSLEQTLATLKAEA